MSFKITFQKVAHKLGRNKTYDWYGALFILALSLCCVFLVNGFFFYRYALPGEATPENGTQGSVSLNPGDITKAVKNIQQRDASGGNIPSIVRIDPSL